MQNCDIMEKKSKRAHLESGEHIHNNDYLLKRNDKEYIYVRELPFYHSSEPKEYFL